MNKDGFAVKSITQAGYNKMFDMKTIRPDICIALRMIALQEMWRKGQEFLDDMDK
jgi:hypothetical protein